MEPKDCTLLSNVLTVAALKAAATTGVDWILICGSLYLAGEVLAQNGEPPA